MPKTSMIVAITGPDAIAGSILNFLSKNGVIATNNVATDMLIAIETPTTMPKSMLCFHCQVYKVTKTPNNVPMITPTRSSRKI